MRARRNEAPAKAPQESSQPNEQITSEAIDKMDHYDTIAKNMIVPLLTLMGWLVDKLPAIAALCSICWMGYQWYHSPSMTASREKRRARKVKVKR